MKKSLIVFVMSLLCLCSCEGRMAQSEWKDDAECIKVTISQYVYEYKGENLVYKTYSAKTNWGIMVKFNNVEYNYVHCPYVIEYKGAQE